MNATTVETLFMVLVCISGLAFAWWGRSHPRVVEAALIVDVWMLTIIVAWSLVTHYRHSIGNFPAFATSFALLCALAGGLRLAKTLSRSQRMQVNLLIMIYALAAAVVLK